MKFGRFMGAGYRNYFPEGAYNGFSCDNHGTFVMGNNCHIKYNGEITITNDHPTMDGRGIHCTSRKCSDKSGFYIILYKKIKVLRVETAAYDIDNGDSSEIGPTLKIDGHGRMTHNCNDQFLFNNNINHSMWWAHIENIKLLFHRNGYGHCGRFLCYWK